MIMKASLLLLVSVSALIATSSSALKDGGEDALPSQCVAMSDITTLSLENSKTTTRLRTGNVPKLQCAGNCPSEAAVSNVHCTRQGMDDMGNPTWRCVPEFAISSQVTKRVYGLNNVRVQCEGCTKKGDPDVTAGSCIVQYGISEIGRINPRRGARGGSHHNNDDTIGIIFFFIFTLAMIYVLMKACKSSRRHAAEESVYAGGAYPGIPLDAKGNPIHNGHHQPQHHHHHHGGGGGGFGGGGFGTGMMTGFLVGDAMSHMHHGGGGYGGGGYDDGGGYGGGYDGGGGGFGDGGGFGGTDFV